MISLNNELISFILNLHIYYDYYCLNLNLISRVLEHSDLSMTSKNIHVSFISVLGLISSLNAYKPYSQSRNEIYINTLESERTKDKESYDHDQMNKRLLFTALFYSVIYHMGIFIFYFYFIG
jgi:hypothetical protein